MMAARCCDLLTSLLLLVSLLAHSVTGDILLKQIEVVTQGTATPWTVEGVATYAHGGDVVRHFLFRCTSTINKGDELTWSRKTGDLTKTQTVAPGGIDLDFGSSPTASDAGVYVCRDGLSDDIAELNITDKNPGACPAHSGELHAVIGETVAIEFYASGLPRTQAGNYTWWHNDVVFPSGMFEKDKRRLVIPNVQESDGGEYRFRVLLRFGAILQLQAFAITRLVVAAAPQITQELLTVTTATEWESVTLTCTVNSTLAPNVVWGRVGGALPPSHQSYTNKGVATLIIPTVRFADMGEYYFNASYTSQTTGTVHYASSTTQLNIIPAVRLRMNNAPLIRLLYHTVGSSFAVSCQGSGQLMWTGPAGANITIDTSGAMYQTINDGALHFNSFSVNYSGMYTCTSSVGASESLLITSENPIVHAPMTNVRVALNSNATLQVYTGGSDPTPTAGNIQWYKDSAIITSGTNYTLSPDRTQLTIRVTSSDVAGIYKSRVLTTQGQRSAFINVSFPDPPVVRVEPSSQTVVEGGSTSFQCSANGTLPHSMQWMFRQSSILPAGVAVTENTSTLVISDVNREHSGEYSCVVKDEINTVTATVMLLVKYAPTAGVGYTPQTSQPSLSISYDESKTPRTFSCSSDGYPSPSLVWQFNGGRLPDGLVSIPVDTATDQYLQLQWRRDLRYGDMGQYQCVAENELNTSTANLNIIVTARARISTIYPSPNSQLLVDVHSPALTFLLPRNNTRSSALTCVSRGLPNPKVEWRTPNGTKLTTAFVTHSEGVVSTVLSMSWTGNQPISVVECVTFNETVMDKQSVRITTTDSVILMPNGSISPLSNRRINFVIRILNYTDCEDSSSVDLLQQTMVQILSRVAISRCPQCLNAINSITIDTTSCSTVTSSIPVLKGHIETPDLALTNLLYHSLEEWRQTGPVVFINGSWALLDKTCLLLAPLDSREECTYMAPPTIQPTAAFINSITFYVVVGASGFVVIVVMFTALLVIICCAVNRRKHHAVANLSYSPSKKRCSSDGLYSPTTTVSSMAPMMENEEYMMNTILRSTIQRHSLENKPSFTEMDELFLRRSPSEQRVLSTTPTEGIDSPSPTGGKAHTFHAPITTQRLQGSGAVVGASINSINSIPVNEILYDPMPAEPTVEHTYDQVHTRAHPPRHDSQGSKVSLRHDSQSSKVSLRSHAHRLHSPAPEIPAYATTPMSSVVNEPEPYQTPGLSDSPHFPMRGSSTGLSSTLPRPLPQPYQQPASQSRKGSLATLTSLTSTANRMPRGAFSASIDSIKPVGSHVTAVEDDRMTVAGSDAPSSQAWYNNFADSDTGVPTGPTSRHEITPYASIRNSQIQANPYQQPVWTSASQFSIRSSSPSTHIETIHV